MTFPGNQPSMPIPYAAIQRIRSQTTNNSTNLLTSSQAECFITISSYTDLGTWLTGPPAEDYMWVIIQDLFQVLPYSALELRISQDADDGPDTPYRIHLFEVAGDTAAQAAARMAAQFNVKVSVLANQFPNLRSMYAVGSGASLLIYMPWGVLGDPAMTNDGPLGAQTCSNGNSGRDVPICYGILGPRRHVFAAGQNEDQGYYYGPPPVE